MEIEKIQDAIARHLAAGSDYMALTSVAMLVNELVDRLQSLEEQMAHVRLRLPPPRRAPAREMPLRLVEHIIGRHIIEPVATEEELPDPPPFPNATCWVGQDLNGSAWDWCEAKGKWVRR